MDIARDKLTFEWVTNYYDAPLAGFARFEGRLYHVRRDDPDDEVFAAEIVGPGGWCAYRWRRWLFETCVGGHWSRPKVKEKLVQTEGGIWVKKRNHIQRVLFILYYWRSAKPGNRIKFAKHLWKTVLR